MIKKKIQSPAYAQIALDIASRIARGELKENTKISGRSTLSSEYQVSPETIRRSIILLEQTGIVDVAEKSGIYIKSKDKAVTYLQQYSYISGVELLKEDLNDAFSKKAQLEKEIQDIIEQIVELSGRFKNIDPLNKFEIIIPENSWLIDKTLKSTEFYQNTFATVIAIKRDHQLITSPDPLLPFKENDVLVIIGSIETIENVRKFVEGNIKD